MKAPGLAARSKRSFCGAARGCLPDRLPEIPGRSPTAGRPSPAVSWHFRARDPRVDSQLDRLRGGTRTAASLSAASGSPATSAETTWAAAEGDRVACLPGSGSGWSFLEGPLDIVIESSMGTDSALDRMCALRMRTGGTFHVYTRLLAILVGRRNHTDSDDACDFDGLKGGCGQRNAHVAS
jgi:hypothetical protein